jgi:hypothetical protein
MFRGHRFYGGQAPIGIVRRVRPFGVVVCLFLVCASRAVYRRGETGQVARALRILHALRGYPEGRTLADLASQLDVSARTIKRDLAELADAQIKIDRTPIGGRAAARLEDESHRTIAITRRERYTLLAIRRMFDVLKGTPLAEDVDSVLAKLWQRATAHERAELAADRDRFAYVPDGGTKVYRGKEDVLDALQTGVLMRKIVRYAYRGARGRATRGFLAPFSMLLFKHGLYVIGRKVSAPKEGRAIPRGQPQIFAAERFSEAEHLRDHPFVVPSERRHMLAGGLYERTSGAAGQPLVGYRRRAPERIVLHELVAGHAQTLLAELRQADPDGGGLPRYLERELAAYLRCGILAHGFARVRTCSCSGSAG